MKEYISLFETTAAYNAAKDNLDLPNVAYCKEENEVHYNPKTWADEYLTLVALENGTISFNIEKSMGTNMITSISYSKDNGDTWTTTNNIDNKSGHLVIDVNVNEGDKILWKGDASQLGYLDENDEKIIGSFFSSTCEFDAKGNVMSLLYGDNFKGKTTIEEDYAFCYLFSDYNEVKICNIVNARNLSLPATTLTDFCYYSMFIGCTSLTEAPQLPATTLKCCCYNYMFLGCTNLTTAPELPATTLADSCYNEMFKGCTSLTTAPELPATTLAINCYSGMFRGCTNLTTAPELSAETLAGNCYHQMFKGCTSLVTAPELPAETLAGYCYSEMFRDCTSLTTAPELPAITLVYYCYDNMFSGCTNLNYIKAMFTTTPSTTYTEDWVNGVAATGTFVKNSAATWTTTGNNGIPNGWTVETASN